MNRFPRAGSLALCAVAVFTAVFLLLRIAQPVHGSEAPVTFNRQIAPLVYKNCATCHHPGGGGPFSLLTFEEVRRRGPEIAAVTASRYMPPWLPAHGYGDFEGERGLSEEQIALLQRWVSTGMPRGDERDAPPVPHYDETWSLGRPDLVLSIERPATLPASGSDVFLNFVLPYPLEQTHFIRAMEIRPAAPEVVHHANLLIDRTGSWRREHPGNWRDGVPGMELTVDAGNTFDPDSHFLFWKPDTPALVEPDGMPWRLDPGNDLVLNMHLKPSGKPETVAAQIGLYFTKAAPTKLPMLLQLEHDSALDIPAGKSDFTVEDELTLPVDVDLLGIYPHAHYLGKDLQAYAILPNGKKTRLIWIHDWDIDRQSVYRYRKPVFLPKGTSIRMRYVYDNSAGNVRNPNSPPVEVRAGNRSVDEMGHLWLQVLPVGGASGGQDPRLELEIAWMRARLRKEPGDPLALYNLAAALTNQGHDAEAIESYKRLLDANPGNARAWNGLGVALGNSNDWPSALQAFQKAAEADPAMTDAIFNLARGQLDHGDPAAAETSFRALLHQTPQDSAAHSGLGQALLKQGKEEEAEAEFQASLKNDAENVDALSALGQLALSRGDPGHAVPWLERARRRDPDDPALSEQLAFAYAQLGRNAEAAAMLRQSLTRAPNDPQIHAVLSQVYSADGQLPQAIAEQEEALRLDPQDADGWNNLGVLEVRAGKPEAARAGFEHALHLSPGHANAKANLARLGNVAQKP
jgi:Flp pilus assembly protein TadD/mono/diheme cytochrome c family protein